MRCGELRVGLMSSRSSLVGVHWLSLFFSFSIDCFLSQHQVAKPFDKYMLSPTQCLSLFSGSISCRPLFKIFFPFHSSYLTGPQGRWGVTPVRRVLCLCPDIQCECPLRLSSAVELFSAKQQQQSQLQCASWIETLPYKALGTVAPANFFLLQNKPVSLLHTSSGETLRPLSEVFFWFQLQSSEEDPATCGCASPQLP